MLFKNWIDTSLFFSLNCEQNGNKRETSIIGSKYLKKQFESTYPGTLQLGEHADQCDQKIIAKCL